MSFFGKAKCFAGLHDWASWTYLRDSDCSQSRRCIRGCGKTEARTEHAWSEFHYTAPGRCDQTRTCRRCALSESRLAHEQWGDWAYEDERLCLQRRWCDRCSDDETRMAHVWSAWQYAGPVTCDQMRSCQRCTKEQELKPAEDEEHRWEEFRRVNCLTMTDRCSRCMKTKMRFGIFHDFGPWMRDPERGFLWRKCRDCGETDIE